MIKVDMPIIVEGKYDKIKLKSIIDGVILTTEGYGIYKNKEKMALIRKYAEKSGIIILTDSDGAGFQIRNHLKSALGNVKIVNIYIPDIFGKERRKAEPSKEGKLGVEGVDKDILIKAFTEAGVIASENSAEGKEPWLTKSEYMALGLSGGENSSFLRAELAKRLRLPERISGKALFEALNELYSKEEIIPIMNEIQKGKQ
ncbi:MAG: toprim domain-containing protein [Ruminiclostridium sp.]